MKIESGKYYERRDGIVAKAMRSTACGGCDLRIGDAYYDSSREGSHKMSSCDIIAEVAIVPVLPFELKAGERYELDNGEVVQLRKPAHYSAVYLEAYPFECVAGCNSCCVTQAGNLVQIADGMTIGRIVRQHVSPTPIERLESLTHEFGEITSSKCVEIRDELRAIIADLKATVTP